MDEGGPGGSIEESRDLHADAMRAVRPAVPALVEVRRERWDRPVEVDPDEIDSFNVGRRRLLTRLGLGAAGGSWPRPASASAVAVLVPS